MKKQVISILMVTALMTSCIGCGKVASTTSEQKTTESTVASETADSSEDSAGADVWVLDGHEYEIPEYWKNYEVSDDTMDASIAEALLAVDETNDGTNDTENNIDAILNRGEDAESLSYDEKTKQVLEALGNPNFKMMDVMFLSTDGDVDEMYDKGEYFLSPDFVYKINDDKYLLICFLDSSNYRKEDYPEIIEMWCLDAGSFDEYYDTMKNSEGINRYFLDEEGDCSFAMSK